eukprot:9743640-Alexandrium_andersonii.AAC.1
MVTFGVASSCCSSNGFRALLLFPRSKATLHSRTWMQVSFSHVTDMATTVPTSAPGWVAFSGGPGIVLTSGACFIVT